MNPETGNTTPYPVGLMLREKNCLIVGGGSIALRKTCSLQEHGARVTIVSPLLCEELLAKVEKREIEHIERKYRREDLFNKYLVIAATGIREVNHRVSRDARMAKVLVNVVDDEKLSDFILPAYFTRRNLLITVSTSGKSPALAKKLRDVLARQIGQEYADMVDIAGRVRKRLRSDHIHVPPQAWQRALDTSSLVELIGRDLHREAEEQLYNKLAPDNNELDK